ncbi:hypothetical protein GCM10027347_33250 [Larkinella harenae]
MKRYLFFLWAVVFLAQGCRPHRDHYQLVYRTDAGGYQLQTPDVRAVKVHWHPYQVQVTTDAGQKKVAPTEQLWGYQQTNGRLFRLYLGKTYEVVEEKTLTLYRQSEFGEGATEHYFFSVTPDEPVLSLNRHNLEAAFVKYPCMQDVIQQTSARTWLKTRQHHNRLIEAYEHCRQQTALQQRSTGH